MARYRHIALFRLHEGVGGAEQDAAVAALRSLASFPGIVEWTVELSLDERKGTVIVENGLFEARSDFEAWRVWDGHRAVAQCMSEISDWWIGDYEED